MLRGEHVRGTGDARRWLFAGLGGLAALALAVLALAVVPSLLVRDSSAPTAGSADAGFARDMAVHHQQAVDLSFIVRERTDDADVRRLAFDIINTQANQRGMLLGRLDVWDLPTVSGDPPMTWMGHRHKAADGSLMPGMATDTQIEELRRAEGKAAEVLYLRLMTEHHRAGVEMARGALELAEDDQLTELAEGMVNGQLSEMELMAAMLADRGAKTAE
jgi:uncharacterized protein (DUF305 family)